MVAGSIRRGENLEKLNLNGENAKEKWPALSLLTFSLGKGIETILDTNVEKVKNEPEREDQNASALSKKSKKSENKHKHDGEG